MTMECILLLSSRVVLEVFSRGRYATISRFITHKLKFLKDFKWIQNKPVDAVIQ